MPFRLKVWVVVSFFAQTEKKNRRVECIFAILLSFKIFRNRNCRRVIDVRASERASFDFSLTAHFFHL